MKRHWLNAIAAPVWRTVYNEGQAGGQGGGEGGSQGGEGGTQGGEGGNNPTPAQGKVYTQVELDGILAKEKRKLQELNQAQIKQLEDVKKQKGLSDKAKEELSAKIEELTNASLTKEELAAKERDKLLNLHKTEREQLSADRDNWRNNYTRATIERSIMDAAVTSEAFNPKQIVNLLKGQTRLVEITDNDGNVIPGEFAVKVKIDALDKEHKPIVLDLTPDEAMKYMKDKTDEYGNLFKSGLLGGLGGNTGKSPKPLDPKHMDHNDYMKHRSALLGNKE